MLRANCAAVAAYHRANMHDDILTKLRPVQTVLFELENKKKQKFKI